MLEMRAELQKARKHAPDSSAAGGGPPRMLVIDDDPMFRGICEGVLSGRFAVTHAPDGITGFQKAFIMRPQFIILDLNLPGISGLQVLRYLNADPDLKNIPVAVMTAMTLCAEDRSAIERFSNVRTFIEKSGKVQDLISASATLLAPG